MVDEIEQEIQAKSLTATKSGWMPALTEGNVMNQNQRAMREMPIYLCHKKVWALKIKEVRQAPADQECANAGGDWYLIPEDNAYGPIVVGHDAYYAKHRPEAGGYYVVYEDGYKSYSPAKAFESGYAPV